MQLADKLSDFRATVDGVLFTLGAMNVQANQWHWLCQPTQKNKTRTASRSRTLLWQGHRASSSGPRFHTRGRLHLPHAPCGLTEKRRPTLTEHANATPASNAMSWFTFRLSGKRLCWARFGNDFSKACDFLDDVTALMSCLAFKSNAWLGKPCDPATLRAVITMMRRMNGSGWPAWIKVRGWGRTRR